MAVRKRGEKTHLEGSETAGDPIAQRVVAFAEQLGSLIGTVQTKAEGWLDREALRKEIGRIRDGAAELLQQVNREATSRRKASKPTAAPARRASRGPVDAPGKRHRKPLPPERIDKLMGEPIGKQKGQKNAKTGRRGGRG
jgi:hypothetical protein